MRIIIFIFENLILFHSNFVLVFIFYRLYMLLDAYPQAYSYPQLGIPPALYTFLQPPAWDFLGILKL